MIRPHTICLRGFEKLSKYRYFTSFRYYKNTVSQKLFSFGETHQNKCFISDYTANMKIIESWNLLLNSNGKVKVNCPFNVVIKTFDPNRCSSIDKVCLKLFAISNCEDQNVNINELNKMYFMKLDYGYLYDDISIKGGVTDATEEYFGNLMPFTCIIEVPFQLDIEVHLRNRGELKLENVEPTNLFVETDGGQVEINNVQCPGLTSLCSNTGSITVRKSHIGNICLETKSGGDISCDKLQGSFLSCSAFGNVAVGSLYCDVSSLISQYGGVSIGPAHGDIDVKTDAGNVNIDTLEGSLAVETNAGDIDVYSVQHDHIRLSSITGNIDIKINDSLQTKFSLSGVDATVDEKLEHLIYQRQQSVLHKLKGSTSKDANAAILAYSKSGQVSLQFQDWFSSLKLNKI